MMVMPNLVEILLHGTIQSIPAKPFTRTGFFADIAFCTNIGNARIVAEAKDIEDGTEAFFLTLKNFDPQHYWVDEAGRSSWPPSDDKGWSAVDLVREWANKIGGVLENRHLTLFTDPQDLALGLAPMGPLCSAAAMRISGNDDRSGLVVYATPEYPCSLELVTDIKRATDVLSRLQETQVCFDRH